MVRATALPAIMASACLASPPEGTEGEAGPVPPGCDVVIDDSFDDDAASDLVWLLTAETPQSSADFASGSALLATSDQGFAELAAREAHSLDSILVDMELEASAQGDGQVGVTFETAEDEVLGWYTYRDELIAVRGFRSALDRLCGGACLALDPGAWQFRFEAEGEKVRFDARPPGMDWQPLTSGDVLAAPVRLTAWSYSETPGDAAQLDVHWVRRLDCSGR